MEGFDGPYASYDDEKTSKDDAYQRFSTKRIAAYDKRK
jgi:hypothetical protein